MQDVITLSRRHFLTGAAALTGATALDGRAHAKAPPVNTQAPGFYRFKLGAIEATVVSDGPLSLGAPSDFFKGLPKPQIDKLLEQRFASPAAFAAEQNALVLNLGSQLVLVDTGVGASPAFGADAGRLTNSLRQAGIDPKDIDAVVITHGHVDHVGGLMNGGARNFPNARLYMTQADYDFWTDEGKLGSPLKDFIQAARDALVPNRDRITFVKDGEEFLPGVQAMATPGHTVGHISLMITSRGQSLFNTADIVHHYVLAAERPRLEFTFDTDAKLAVKSRLRALDMLSKDRIPMLAYHFPWPGIGHMAKSGGGYRYMPAPVRTVL